MSRTPEVNAALHCVSTGEIDLDSPEGATIFEYSKRFPDLPGWQIVASLLALKVRELEALVETMAARESATVAKEIESSADILARFQNAEARVKELETWKESALAVEKEWDAQKVGTLLGLPLGTSIRAGIEPAVTKLLVQNDKLREALEQIGEHRGEGSLAAPWRDIVRMLGQKARTTLAETKGTQ